MPRITLPDGSVKEFPQPVTAKQVAEAIGPRLAKDAVGAKIDGELRDLSAVIDRDAKVSIVTPMTRDKKPDADALFLLRHSAAHVMAEAIQQIVPNAQLVYGPPLEDKFYYDIKFPEHRPLRESDFQALEAEMKRIIAEDRAFTRLDLGVAAAINHLKKDVKNKYKFDNAFKAARINAQFQEFKQGQSLIRIPGQSHHYSLDDLCGNSGQAMQDAAVLAILQAHDPTGPNSLSFYYTGDPGAANTWNDLCRGPHLPSTGRIGAVKILSLASSYWHGDENSDRLTRVYGTAFFSQADLDEFLKQKEEAVKRDHRVIGKALRLFHIDEDVGQGLILWTPAGGVIRQELQNFISAELRKQGYHQVFTPQIGRLELYKTSGHFPYYKDAQFPPIVERDTLDRLANEGCSCADLVNRVEAVSAHLASRLNQRTKKQTIPPDRVRPDDQLVEGFLLRPMNCPHHIKIFASQQYSYRDMPIRLAEFGTVYRWEQSGELNGMTRVRGFTQDDAHLFCTEDQVPAELLGCLSLVKIIFGTLGMKDYRVRVGLRDSNSDKYIGDPAIWDKAEEACRAAAKSLGVAFAEEPGEAAFYGPKIDFVVKDVIGREWQLGTVQVDYNAPIRFDLSYIGPDNKPHRPVMIHRAPFGSLERFTGVLIEHFAGAFPTWLSPEQVRVLPISEKSDAYANKVLAALQAAGVRATADLSNDRIQGKIKAATDFKIPYLLVVGPKDEEAGKVSIRARGIQKDLGAMDLTAFVSGIEREIRSRGAETVAASFT